MLLPYRRRVYRTSRSSQELSEVLAEKVAPKDPRGVFSVLTGQEPTQPYSGVLNKDKQECRLCRVPQGGRRLLDVDLWAHWEPQGDKTRIVMTQKVFPWLWMVAVVGLVVAGLSALGEYFDRNWEGILTDLGIYVGIYVLHVLAFRQTANLNEEFFCDLWGLEPE